MKIDEILNDLENKGEEIKEFYANDIRIGDVVHIPDLRSWSQYGVVLVEPHGDHPEWIILLTDEHIIFCDERDRIESCHINIPEIEYIKDGLRSFTNEIYS